MKSIEVVVQRFRNCRQNIRDIQLFKPILVNFNKFAHTGSFYRRRAKPLDAGVVPKSLDAGLIIPFVLYLYRFHGSVFTL